MWNTLIINPLSNTLQYFYIITGSIGMSIIILTLIIRLILVPLQISATRTSKNMKKVQPELNKLKEKYKNNPREMMKEMSKLYKENKIKPFSSLLGLLIQLPIVIGLYIILDKQLHSAVDINHIFFSIDLIKPSIFLAFLTLITMFILMKITAENIQIPEEGSQTQKDFTRILKLQMLYFLPIMTFVFTIFLPAGLAVYFITGNIFLIIQNILFNKYIV